MWTIAFGIVLGLMLWFWVMPLMALIVFSNRFWRGIWYVLLALCTWAGIIGLFDPQLQWAVWFLLVPIIFFYKKYKSTKVV